MKSKHYGIDVVGRMESMLVDELSKSIDAEIIKSILELGKNRKRMAKIKKIISSE